MYLIMFLFIYFYSPFLLFQQAGRANYDSPLQFGVAFGFYYHADHFVTGCVFSPYFFADCTRFPRNCVNGDFYLIDTRNNPDCIALFDDWELLQPLLCQYVSCLNLTYRALPHYV